MKQTESEKSHFQIFTTVNVKENSLGRRKLYQIEIWVYTKIEIRNVWVNIKLSFSNFNILFQRLLLIVTLIIHHGVIKYV